MASEPAGVEQPIRFGEGYEVDLRPRRLRRGSHVLKLERIPFEILLLEHRDEIVTRDQIVSRVWGHGVFLDTDNSIRGAIRKLRQVLKDDAETPRLIQTVTGQGYRFVALVNYSQRTKRSRAVECIVQPPRCSKRFYARLYGSNNAMLKADAEHPPSEDDMAKARGQAASAA